MSVYVKGLEMPTNCAQCACCDDDARYCQAAHKYIPMIGKPKFCPLVEVPTHDKRTDTHGVCSDELIRRQDAMMEARPEYLNPIQKGHEEYNKAWNDAIEAYWNGLKALPSAIEKGCDSCRFDNRYGEESICSSCARHYSDCYAPQEEGGEDD